MSDIRTVLVIGVFMEDCELFTISRLTNLREPRDIAKFICEEAKETSPESLEQILVVGPDLSCTMLNPEDWQAEK